MVEDRRNQNGPLEIGTVNLVVPERTPSGQTVLRLKRNSFIELPASRRLRTLVSQMRAPHVIHGTKLYVLGDHAFELADAVGGASEASRSDGTKTDPLPLMKSLLGRIAEPADARDGEIMSSVPSDPSAVLTHGSFFEALLHTLSSRPAHVIDGHSISFSPPADEEFAGIGIFCGGGLFDLCVAYKSLPAIFFSTSKGGEWVDIEAATDLGVSAWIEKPRKNGHGHEGNGSDTDIAGYYRNLVNGTLNNIKGQLKPLAKMRTFPDPISIVFSGATSMSGNFIELVRTVYREPAPAPQAAAPEAAKPAPSPITVDRLAALKALSKPVPQAAKKTPQPEPRAAAPDILKPALSQTADAPPAPRPVDRLAALKAVSKPVPRPAWKPAPEPGLAEETEENIDLSEVAMQLETADPDEGMNGAAERRIVDFRRFLPAAGRGLDVGTSNVVGAVRAFTGASPCNVQRNAFLDVRSDSFTEKLLMKLGVDRYDLGPKRFVIGNPAFDFANIFEKATRRPMKNGVISPQEPDAVHVEGLVIRSVLGQAHEKGEICAYSLQADPIDAERNAVYHSGAIETILRQLGYAPRPVLEGQAVVYAELADEDYTGIGISCGGGMFNICISYKSLPALSFSISRGGDWIDSNVAQSLGLPSSQVCAIKESGVDLNDPKGRIEEAICIYYRNLIHYSIETIRERFESAQNMPAFRAPISVVCSGGTSMIKGFIDVFRQEFEAINFPIPIKEIRRARDPLKTVARGCLEAALLETRAASESQAAPRIERAAVSSVSPAPARQAPSVAARTQVQEPGKSPWWVVVPKPERNRPLSGPACA